MVHAQLTISHPGGTLTSTHQVPKMTKGGSGAESTLHFDYSWVNNSPTVGPTTITPTKLIPFSSGIQKFESWAVPRSRFQAPTTSTTFVGTGSDEQLELGLWRKKVVQPYDRRCKSTCSITLGQPPLAQSQGQSQRGWSEERALVTKTAALRDAETQTMSIGNGSRDSAPRTLSRGTQGSTSASTKSTVRKVVRSNSSPPNPATLPGNLNHK